MHILNQNTFANVSLLVLYTLLIVWFSYIIDKNRKDEAIDKGVITINFIVDITLLILSVILFIDSFENIDIHLYDKLFKS